MTHYFLPNASLQSRIRTTASSLQNEQVIMIARPGKQCRRFFSMAAIGNRAPKKRANRNNLKSRASLISIHGRISEQTVLNALRRIPVTFKQFLLVVPGKTS